MQQEQPFFEHLAELRNRLLNCVVWILLGSIVSYYYSGLTFDILTAPFQSQFSKAILIGTAPGEAFILKLKLAFFSGILVVSPVLFWNCWKFVAPGLHEHEKKLIAPFISLATALFLVGIYFCYYYVVPVALKFFSDEYTSINLSPTIKISDYSSMLMQMLLAFGLVFEMPLISILFARAGFLTADTLIKYWRYAVVIIFIFSAVFTPPDVMSQLLMAIPMLALYLLSILLVKLTAKNETN